MLLQEYSFAEEDAVRRLHVDYAIRSDDLDPAEITAELGLFPSRAWKKYDEYTGKALDPRTGQTITRMHRRPPWGLWAIRTESIGLSRRVEDHIRYLLDLLEPKSEHIKRFLEQYDAVSCYVWWEPFDGHGSYVVSSPVLSRIAQLCHYVEFGVVYSTPEDDEADPVE